MRVVPVVANANRLHLEPQGRRLGENIGDKLFFVCLNFSQPDEQSFHGPY